MAKDIDCSACEELRENAPNFVQNGITDTECNSLKNDTGFNPRLTTLHTDCEDLDTANDCLIGMMDGEIEKYEPCDWQKYMHKFIPNLYQFLKAEVCALCGIWTNIHQLWKNVRELWERLIQAEKDIDNLEDRMDVAENDIDNLQRETDRIDCVIDFLSEGITFNVGEDPTAGSYVVPGQGVSYLTRSEGDRFSVNVYMTYIGGGLGYISGSLSFYANSFTDADGTRRSGNPAWARTGKPYYTDEMIYEIRIKKSQYPQIRSFRNGMGQESYAGGFHIRVLVYTAGEYADGQHGGCYQDNGDPMEEGGSRGHLVPDGWVYVQTRMTWIDYLGDSDPRDYTPVGFLGMRVNTGNIDC